MAKLSIDGYTEKFPYPESKDRFFDIDICLKSASGSLAAKVRVWQNAGSYFWGWSIQSVDELDEKWNYKLSESVLNWAKENIK